MKKIQRENFRKMKVEKESIRLFLPFIINEEVLIYTIIENTEEKKLIYGILKEKDEYQDQMVAEEMKEMMGLKSIIKDEISGFFKFRSNDGWINDFGCSIKNNTQVVSSKKIKHYYLIKPNLHYDENKYVLGFIEEEKISTKVIENIYRKELLKIAIFRDLIGSTPDFSFILLREYQYSLFSEYQLCPVSFCEFFLHTSNHKYILDKYDNTLITETITDMFAHFDWYRLHKILKKYNLSFKSSKLINRLESRISFYKTLYSIDDL